MIIFGSRIPDDMQPQLKMILGIIDKWCTGKWYLVYFHGFKHHFSSSFIRLDAFRVHLGTLHTHLSLLGDGDAILWVWRIWWANIDAAIKPVAEPEVDPIPYSTRRGTNQDIHALKCHIL